jgi:hypothetical protein
MDEEELERHMILGDLRASVLFSGGLVVVYLSLVSRTEEQKHEC